ncbi:MAG: NAD(P)-binding domain-containing protein, partial [Spirochaetaceae bacterium]|nr:NAD(P)-binding domain-containing protein [Spirochaetaceae bacterium]
METKVACIGSGNMGFALMKGAAGLLGGSRIGFSDADRSRAKAAAGAIGGAVYESNTAAAEAGDFIFLAVKPQALEAVLREIAPALRERAAAGRPAVLVSMAAGWSIGKIQAILALDAAPPAQVIRIMPNTPALISRGVIAMTAPPEVDGARAAEAEKILGAVGIVDRLPESYL